MGIVKTVVDNVLIHSPNAIIVVFPIQWIPYLALKSTDCQKTEL
jgi:malate dehydrogenase